MSATNPQNLPAERKAELPAVGGAVTAIIPKTVEDMFRIASAFHKSELAPRTLNSPEKCLIAIMGGAELGLAPFQAVQSFYVVNGRPTLWGDAIPALLWANGFKLKEWYEGEGDALVAKCEITRPDGTVIPGEFSMADAKEAKLLGKDGPWQTARRRMLKMRARAFTARDGASDVLRGFQVREEVEDYVEVRSAAVPATSGLAERLAAQSAGTEPAAGFSQAHVARETGAAPAEEAIDAEFEDAGEEQPQEQPDAAEAAGEEGREEVVDEAAGGAAAADDRPALPEGVKTGTQLAAEQAAAGGTVKPLKDIADDFEAALKKAGSESLEAIDGVWDRGEKLRGRLDTVMPERLAELETLKRQLEEAFA